MRVYAEQSSSDEIATLIIVGEFVQKSEKWHVNDFSVVQRPVTKRFVDRWRDLLGVMLSGSPLAAVKPVANELDVALKNDKCPKTVEKLAAVKPVTSVSYPLEEHVKHCRG